MKLKPNETEYKGYIITQWTAGEFEWAHEDYDGAPIDATTPSDDMRSGISKSLEAAKKEIDELEEELRNDGYYD